jgi:hypothetical protein
MTTKVEIGFDLSVNGVGSWFTLDDAAKGVLDNATYTLAGEVLVDVTDKVRDISIKRGRSRTLEKFTAGVASVVLDNRDRAFDPLYAASPYYGSIVPRKMVRISRDNVTLYTGNIEQYAWSYDVGGDATATAQAVDGFATLAQATLTPGTATAQDTGARISAILTDAGWPLTQRVISTGAATLDANVVGDNVGALAAIGQVELSEPGAAFVNANGAFTFLSRADLQNFTTGGITFGTDVPFVEYRAASVTEDMKNAVAVTWSAGTVVGGTATATDATSIATYGSFDVAYDTLLPDSTQAQALADWLVSTYKDPTYRIDSVTVALHGCTDSQVAQVLALELGDNVGVAWTPNSIGSAISQSVVIDQIEHHASPGVEHHVTFTLSQSLAAFLLDSATFGILDSSALGF